MPTFTGAGGAELHYDVAGEDAAAVIIALAGGAARHPEYLGDVGGLTDTWRLLLPHLRGVGRSSAGQDVERGSFWRQAEDIEALRQQADLQRCVLLAHSAGTRLALSYAAQFPERIAGLVLITPPATYLVDVPSDAAAISAHRGEDLHFQAAWAALQQGPDTSGEEAFNAWQRAIAPVGYAAWGPREQAHAHIGRWNLEAARAFLAAAPAPDFVERLQALTAPVLVVAGARDAVTGLAPVEALARLFPAGQLAVLDDCGHYPWVEQSVAFREAVDPFLHGLPSQGRG